MCAPVFSGALLRAVGYVYPPSFWHTHVDDVWEALGTVTGCWWVCMEVTLRHIDAFQTGNVDETHVRAYAQTGADGERYLEWRKSDMDRAVLAILALDDGQEQAKLQEAA